MKKRSAKQKQAMLNARRRPGNGKPLWTKEEDAIVLKHQPRIAVKKLTGRSHASVKQRRFKLLLQRRGEKGASNKLWTQAELRIMRQHYPTEPMARMLELLPKRDRFQITSKASYLGVHRLFRGTRSTAELEGGQELLDQIRERCLQDGLRIEKFNKELGYGECYLRPSAIKATKSVNLAYVVKALDYFGAKLVIDWQDR